MSIEKTWTLLLVAFAALLPFGPALPNILAGIILAFAFLQIVRGQFKLGKKNIIHFVWMNAYVLFLAFSIGWSENQIYGWNKLLLLLFIPLFFLALISSRAYINTRLFVKSIEVFVISNCILLVLSFISAIAKNGLSITGLTQNDLSTALIDFHFLGFSLYSAIGLLLGLFIYFDKQHKMTEIIRKIWPLCLIVLSGGLFLLSSRTTLIMTAIGIVAILLFQRRQIKKKVRISVWLLLVLGSILFIAINPVLQEKIKDAINYEGQYDVKG